ncbi:MAG: hypothetical protein PWQ10_53 [Patescibacteria group bacterium]|nr:hypothetical protein [Patescibacteria group bacterium]
MKDLDFDELDKAVNSLVTNDSGSTNGNNTRKKTFDVSARPSRTPINSHFSSSTPPSRPNISPIANNTPVSPLGPSLAGRRSTGRFMDVVHPSSDMRTSLVMPNRVSGEDSAPKPTPMTSSISSAVKPNTTSMDDVWPDPISLNDNNPNNQPKLEAEDSYDDADIDKISDDIDNTLDQIANEPQESPFLSGTKVEKRPLGAFSTEQVATASNPVLPESKEPPVANKSTGDRPVPYGLADDEAPLQDELQDELLLIESGGVAGSDQESSDTVVNKSADTPKVEAPTSISQQYKEKPSTGDHDSAAIYDINTYHKAIIKPTKKKSGWLLVLWIFILLIVGAGAGAVVYLWVLPLL